MATGMSPNDTLWQLSHITTKAPFGIIWEVLLTTKRHLTRKVNIYFVVVDFFSIFSSVHQSAQICWYKMDYINYSWYIHLGPLVDKWKHRTKCSKAKWGTVVERCNSIFNSLTQKGKELSSSTYWGGD